MNLETELKLLGLRPTKQDLERIREAVISERRKRVVKPIREKHHLYSCIILNMALAKSLNELMHMIEKDQLKFKMKSDFYVLKKRTEEAYLSFENFNRNNKVLMDAYNFYVEEFCEMIYNHVDDILDKD